MGKPFRQYLDSHSVYSCAGCSSHISDSSSVISKAFSGSSGRAYLVSAVVNCRTGLKETRNLMTGLHICEDLFCMHCNACIGWKYVEAQDPEQKYKEGKYIIEKARLNLEELTTA